MALLILALLQRIFLMSSLMLLLVWLIFFMVLIKLLPILGTISGKTVKLMVLALICLGNRSEERRVGKECRSWWSSYCYNKNKHATPDPPSKTPADPPESSGSAAAATCSSKTSFFFFKQKTAYEIGLGIPAEPLFRSSWY